MTIRALYRAAKVQTAAAPYDTLHLKVFYPADDQAIDAAAREFGQIPPETRRAPFPVVLFFGGLNCHPEGYRWLAMSLAERGIVVVTFAWIAQDLPGMIALSPGLDASRLTPDAYGEGPTAAALTALLSALAALQAEGPLAGLLDLQRVVLGGHSAGGRVAIESASRRCAPQLAGAFAYAAHTAAFVQLGFPPGTFLALPDELPLLLLGGTNDGVIASSAQRYGTEWADAATPLRRTLSEAIAGGRRDSWLLLIEGANHFAVTDPFDPTTGRAFLDQPLVGPAAPIRALIAEAVGLFLDAQLRNDPDAGQRLERIAAHPLIAYAECR
ncbi:MAG: dienelactone hydrolase [Chromatiaceae bacterium]|nr:MAG: dienelactone hydrolase [Chromatiaceae bacterium]